MPSNEIILSAASGAARGYELLAAEGGLLWNYVLVILPTG